MNMNHSKFLCFFCDPYQNNIHNKVETGILSEEFKADSIIGFQVYSRRKSSISASYIEKREFVEGVIDPFGNKIEFQRIEYQQTNFILKKEPPNIIILDPPRYYRKLLNKIAQLTDYNIVIEDLSVNLLDWVEEIFKGGVNGTVNKMQIDRINYDSKTTGSLILSSDMDLRPKLTKILASKSYFLNKITVSFDKDSDLPIMQLGSNGKVSFSRSIDTEKIYNIYLALSTVISINK